MAARVVSSRAATKAASRAAAKATASRSVSRRPSSVAGRHRAPSRSRRPASGTKGRSTAASRTGSSATRARRRAPNRRAAQASRRGGLVFLVVSFFILGTLVVGVVALQAVVSQGSFRMQELARRNVELQQQYGRLKLQVAELSSPARIAKQGRRLGLHLPGPEDLRPLSVKGNLRGDSGTSELGRPAFSLKSLLEARP